MDINQTRRHVIKTLGPSKARRKRFRFLAERLAPRTTCLVVEYPERKSAERIRAFVSARLSENTFLPELEGLFIHIPKTGGSSVTDALKPFGMLTIRSLHELETALLSGTLGQAKFLSLDHLDSGLLASLGLIRAERLNEVNVVAITRNPFDRAWSAFQHVKARGMAARLLPTDDFSAYIHAISKKNYFSGLRPAVGLSHGSPQSLWLRTFTKHPKLQTVPLEKLREIQLYFLNQWGVQIELPHSNPSLAREKPPLRFPHLGLFLDKFRNDFVTGNYSPNPEDSKFFSLR